ncbi:hypothetical protein QBC37DRAFT_73605 [Rhypophila decipiens]|uniref:Uncharacterized protein n=1 Tax=Rhypophila decipiens TaxID=261697 RepID=A0AAN6YJJ6_9PEZI|nr:hypothetical protein QBC37DRAFT_73605 [Rhypophila decipiens]
MDRRNLPFSAGSIPSSPHYSTTPTNRQHNIILSPYSGAINITSDHSPASLGSIPYLPVARGSTNEHMNSPTTQQGQHDRRSTHGQGSHPPMPISAPISRSPSTRRGQRDQHLRNYTNVQIGRTRHAGGSQSRSLQQSGGQQEYSPRDPSRQARRRQMRMQRRLQTQMEGATQENQASRGYQPLEAMTVFDIQEKTTGPFRVMFCPDLDYSAAHPHCTRTLRIRSQSLAQQPPKTLLLPHGMAEASRSTDLVVEHRPYNIKAVVETFLVLNKGTPYRGIDLYLGRRFMNKHCQGKPPRDPYSDSESGDEYEDGEVEVREDMESFFTGTMASGAPTITTATSWGGQASNVGPSFMDSEEAWGTETTAHMGETAPPIEGFDQPQSFRTSTGDDRLPIRQGEGRVPAHNPAVMNSQSTCWQPGTLHPGSSISDPAMYLPVYPDYGYSTNQYVNPSFISLDGGSPEFTNATSNTFYPASQHSAPHQGSTVNYSMSAGYHQGITRQPHGGFNRP